MVSGSDLDTLRAFNSHGHVTLSAYLRLDTPQLRESAHQDFVQRMQDRIDDCGPDPKCLEAIKEDIEIVGLYLKTNGHREHAGLAIFSCAAELFWRAYPLSSPIPTQVAVGLTFDVEPLMQSDSSGTD